MAKTGDVEASIVLLEGDATVDAMDKVRMRKIGGLIFVQYDFMFKTSILMLHLWEKFPGNEYES